MTTNVSSAFYKKKFPPGAGFLANYSTANESRNNYCKIALRKAVAEIFFKIFLWGECG